LSDQAGLRYRRAGALTGDEPARMNFLEPGQTCWRIDQATRAAFLVDVQDYFAAVLAVLPTARRSIHLIGWGFDPRTRLQPDGFEGPDDPDEFGRVLIDLANARPELDVRLLIWKSALPIAASQEFFPHRARAWFKGSRVKFRLDDAVPLGGCHHQKVLVIDDRIAFCSGGDFGTDRWDTVAHLDDDARRIDPSLDYHPPRHEVTMMVEGDAARALGDLIRKRWVRATGETIEARTDADSTAIVTLRNRLVGHYFGRSATDVAHAIERRGGLIAAIDHLNTHGRLTTITPLKLGRTAKFIAAYHLGDPMGVDDAWKPAKRRKLLDEGVRAIAQAPTLKSITSGK